MSAESPARPPRPALLSAAELAALLPSLHADWRLVGAGIERDIRLPDFSSAAAFAQRLAAAADAMKHHPDLWLRYGACRVRWSTHDAGGLTHLDVDAARRTDALIG